MEQREQSSVISLGCCIAACTSVERPSFACRICAIFWIDVIKVGGGVLSVVFEIWCQSPPPLR